MATKKLNQVLAVEKTVKSKRENTFTELCRAVEKTQLVTGQTRTYRPKTDGDEVFPAESQKVQLKVEDAIAGVAEAMREVFNVTAQKDATNCFAKADVVVGGETVLTAVPATHLLWIEKKLASFLDFINRLPTLPQDTVWTYDAGSGLHRSEPVEKARPRKVEDFRVIVPPTKEHPARVEKVVEDVTIGWWTETRLSGAVPEARKLQLQKRCEKYLRAVKEAREAANQTEVVDLATGALVDRIFAP